MSKLVSLRKRGEIDELFRCGRRCRGRLMLVVTRAGPTGQTRTLLSVGRKVGNAVVRNRVRRRLRELLRALLPYLQPGTDVAVAAYGPAGEASYQDLRSELDRLLHRAGALTADAR